MIFLSKKKLEKIYNTQYYKILYLRDNTFIEISNYLINSADINNIPLIVDASITHYEKQLNYKRWGYAPPQKDTRTKIVVLPLVSAKGFIHNLFKRSEKLTYFNDEAFPYYRAVKTEFEYIPATFKEVLEFRNIDYEKAKQLLELS